MMWFNDFITGGIKIMLDQCSEVDPVVAKGSSKVVCVPRTLRHDWIGAAPLTRILFFYRSSQYRFVCRAGVNNK